jgi:Lon protease-like protein
MSQDPLTLENFTGTVRLFPLPNLVLFPNVAQPLHVFEPRYRQLMADSLAADRLIAMALLQPGWEEEYQQRPAVCPVVCVGRIHQEERLPDGRYNLLLQGLCRARIREELKTDRLYRVARVELINDVPVQVPAVAQDLRQALGRAVEPFFAGQALAAEQLARLLASPLLLGALCDIFSSVLPLDVAVKQELLEEAQVERRARLLLDRLETCEPAEAEGEEAPRRRFPPEFSSN